MKCYTIEDVENLKPDQSNSLICSRGDLLAYLYKNTIEVKWYPVLRLDCLHRIPKELKKQLIIDLRKLDSLNKLPSSHKASQYIHQMLRILEREPPVLESSSNLVVIQASAQDENLRKAKRASKNKMHELIVKERLENRRKELQRSNMIRVKRQQKVAELLRRRMRRKLKKQDNENIPSEVQTIASENVDTVEPIPSLITSEIDIDSEDLDERLEEEIEANGDTVVEAPASESMMTSPMVLDREVESCEPCINQFQRELEQNQMEESGRENNEVASNEQAMIQCSCSDQWITLSIRIIGKTLLHFAQTWKHKVEQKIPSPTVRQNELNEQKVGEPVPQESSLEQYCLPWAISHKGREEVYNVVNSALSECCRGDNEQDLQVPSESMQWSVAWFWGKPTIDRTHLLPWQRINRFTNIKQLSRKDLLFSNIEAVKKRNKALVKFVDIIPQTFMLPKEFVQFVHFFTEQEDAGKRNIWIVKPIGLSRGRGISIHSNLESISYDRSVVVQKYVQNPLLLESYKFDLRLYVLVTSFCPLEAFLFEEGFMRKCSKPFSLEKDSLSDKLVHLTNSAIQRNSSTFSKSSEGAMAWETGTDNKLSLDFLWRMLEQDGFAREYVEKVKSDIEETILKALICCKRSIGKEPNSFELLGFDVLLDENLKPWLLEVNSSPSLCTRTSLDLRIKRQLIVDLFTVVNPFLVKTDKSDSLQSVSTSDESLKRMEPKDHRFKLIAPTTKSEEIMRKLS